MYGIIFTELEKFAEQNIGLEAWSNMLDKAGFRGRIFEINKVYPDEIIFSLIEQASLSTGISKTKLIKAFGEFIVPDLIRIYRVLLNPEWDFFDMLENAENYIHRVIRLKNPGANPAIINSHRIGPNEIEINYHSKRKLCPLAEGIILGIAKHYAIEVEITQKSCMYDGQAECLFHVCKKA
jgi:heme-NO-binding protein